MADKYATSIFPLMIILAVSLSVAGAGYIGYKYKYINMIYNSTKSSQRGWTGTPLTDDPTLGLKPRPGAAGAEIFPTGPPIAARISRAGFRISAGDPDTGIQTRLLFLSLGCSFTYGSGCLAEETYTHLVARHFDGQGLNAGGPSYGLAQMYLRGAELIPRYKPDFVIAQYSPWLVDRAITGYLPTYGGRLPSPYFCIGPSEEVAIQAAYYRTWLFAFDFDQFRRSPPGWRDKVRFFAGIGLPLSLHDDCNDILVGIKKKLNLLPEAVQDRSKILLFVYRNLMKLCHDNQARLYILAIDSMDLNDVVSRHEKELLAGIDGAVMIDTTPELRRGVSPAHNPLEIYGHWREGRLVDAHPNATAQTVFAREIIKKIAGPAPGRQ